MKADINLAREWGKFWLGIILAVFGMGIVIFSLLAPPAGVIHASVITVFGSILGFVGAIFGIDSIAKIRMHEQDVDFELKSEQQRRDFDLREKELDDKMKRFEKKLSKHIDDEDLD